MNMAVVDLEALFRLRLYNSDIYQNGVTMKIKDNINF